MVSNNLNPPPLPIQFCDSDSDSNSDYSPSYTRSSPYSNLVRHHFVQSSLIERHSLFLVQLNLLLATYLVMKQAEDNEDSDEAEKEKEDDKGGEARCDSSSLGSRNEHHDPMSPRVSVKRRKIGAAEEVLKVHIESCLTKPLEELPTTRVGFVCEKCRGTGFVPCLQCIGSCKVLEEKVGGKVIRCSKCSEEGLVPCLTCRL